MKRLYFLTCLLASAAPLSEARAVDLRANVDEEPPVWRLELRAGPYRPRISDDPAVRQHYARFYAADNPEPDEPGHDPNLREDDSLFENHPMMKTLELSWYLTDEIGLVGLTGSVGYWRARGSTRVCPSLPGEVCTSAADLETSVAGNDNTSLAIMPVGVGLVYHMDLAMRRYGVPLVPYAKGGADYYFWWNSSGEETTGDGGTFGLHATLGLGLNLDWIEPDTSARGRSTLGMADTTLFFEYSWLFADGFGGDRLDMSDAHGWVGLAVDFL